MATCEVSGTSDMYGLGIRVGFYLQWMSSPATAWIAPGETNSLRTANAFFISATFIGLIIETALNHLDVVEIYVILLLGFGAQYSWLITTLWRVATHFNAGWDPTRHMRAPIPSTMYWFLYNTVQIAQIIFQLWFWLYKIPRTNNECARFGFAFFKVKLTSNGFRIFNVVVMVVLLVLMVVFFALHFRQLWREGRLPLSPLTAMTMSEIQEKREQDRVPEKREKVLCIIDTVYRVISIAMVILATELTITWNKIQGVNDTKSVGQLIPLMIGVGGIGHVVLAVIRGPKTVDEVMQEYYQEDSYNMMVMGASASNGREE
ncbi:hypothetical protein AA0116_g10068 [Alternaria tenuissima]|nr:hypothetical protein AA0116_g10068 [Alternaria tenuissima]